MIKSFRVYFFLFSGIIFLYSCLLKADTLYLGGQVYTLEEYPERSLYLLPDKMEFSAPQSSLSFEPYRGKRLKEKPAKPDISFKDHYVSSAYSFSGQEELFVLNRIFISTDADSLAKILKGKDIQILRCYEWAEDLYLVELQSVRHSNEVLQFVSELQKMESVHWSHPDLLYPKYLRYIPDDPMFPQQWHLSSDESYRHIHAPGAWNTTTGSDEIIIAIIDDGIDTSHPEFSGKIISGRNVVYDTNDPSHTSTSQYHGTSCAGLAAAQGDNAAGVAGVAYDSRIMPIYLIDNNMTIADEVEAFEWAVQQGADIISNSWGPVDGKWENYPLPEAVGEAIRFAVTQGRNGKGIPIFWAAGNGNERTDLDGYASNPYVINVGASTYNGIRANYSDYGESLNIVAPSSGDGYSIVTTYRSGGYTQTFSGTSASAPIAAGTAGLVLSEAEHLSWRGVKAILQRSADKIDFENGQYDEHGFSPWYGYGKINAAAAVELAVRESSLPPSAVNNLEFFIRGSKAFLQWTAPGNDGDEGQALYYDLRYSTQEITAENFEEAGIYHDIFPPSPAGSEQVMSLKGLERETEWFFALKTYDNRENASGLSIVVSGIIPPKEDENLLYNFDFETSAEGWQGEPPWQRVPKDAQGTGYVWMDSPDGDYGNNLDISLTSPVFDFSRVQYVRIAVEHNYLIEERWDAGYLEVSTDGGINWLPPVHGFTGTKSEFFRDSFFLPYSDEHDNVQVRFRLKTDASVTDKGWTIDRILFYGIPLDDYTPSIIISEYTQIPFRPDDEDEVILRLRACHPDGIDEAKVFIRCNEEEYTNYPLERIHGTDECGLYQFIVPPLENSTNVQYYFFFSSRLPSLLERYYPVDAPVSYFEYTVSNPKTWYVSPGGSDENGGTGWDDAFQTIPAALNTAEEYDRIWVRQGTYLGEITIPRGIYVYGGFSGVETDLHQRDIVRFETIISGNNENRGVTNSGRLDGFVILDGVADKGAGIYNHPEGAVWNCRVHSNNALNMGGGIFNEGQVYHSLIYNNSARYGGGIDNYNTVQHCTLYNNQASMHGGGLYNDRGIVDASLLYSNQAQEYGGGISNDGTVINSVLYLNSAQYGGGLDNYGGEVMNCTVYGNSAAIEGGGIFNAIPWDGNARVVNTIMWENHVDAMVQDYHSASINATAWYSIFSEAVEENNNLSLDPKFVDETEKDFRLTVVSPGIRSGSSENAPEYDFYGISRPIGSSIDRGAFEYEGILPHQPRNLFPVSDKLLPEYISLQSSAFQSNAYKSFHRASQWQVSRDLDFEHVVRDTGRTENFLTGITVFPLLEEEDTYFWRVRYQDNFLAWSFWSQSTSFSVVRSTPVEQSIWQLFQ